jgi:hypothetical protein
MDASQVIESYVHDVARRLPAATRDDVAFELRALLTDELATRAEVENRSADAALALALVRDFGRPARTALRYHQPFTILEPSDTWGFLVAVGAGAAVLSVLTAPAAVRADSTAGDPGELGLLAWIGLLVIGFAVKNLVLRHRPDAFAWTPRRVRPADSANRVGGLLVGLLWAVLLVLYLAPGPILSAVTGGRIDAADLVYTESFTSPLRMPWLVALLVAAIGVELLAVVQGRWRPGVRWARILLVFSIGIQIGWHVRYGSIFQDPDIDLALTPVLAGLNGLIVTIGGIALYAQYTRVRPAPAGRL